VRRAVIWYGNGHMQMYAKFQKVFGHCLDDFWLDSVRGLDIEKFDREVVKSEGKFLEVVKERWGREGAAIIRRLGPRRAARKRPKK